MWQIAASGRNLYATVDSTIVEYLGAFVRYCQVNSPPGTMPG